MPTTKPRERDPRPVGDPQPGQSEPNPQPIGDPKQEEPGPDANNRGSASSWELVASKKVDDLSKHESKHDTDPKHDPKHDPKRNAREKTPDGTEHEARQPSDGGSKPGNTRK